MKGDRWVDVREAYGNFEGDSGHLKDIPCNAMLGSVHKNH